MGLPSAAGLDLVEIAPNSVPPVAKILDYGKYKFQAQKKAAEARKKQKVVEIKEIKLRPMIDDHDYQVKMRSMERFFEEGDKVKITLRFRGREMAHQELGYKLLQRVKDDTDKISKVESEPRFEGRQMVIAAGAALRGRSGQESSINARAPVIRRALRFSAARLPSGRRSRAPLPTPRQVPVPPLAGQAGRCRWRPVRRAGC